jgi:DNA-binding transcriptional LysR family regulator
MRSLNLDQLRTLVEVVALGNFSAAARRLNVTQPAVSQHIRELEQRFGVKLIERSGRRAYATAPGRELVEQAAAIFRDCDMLAKTMRRFRDGWFGRVHIGTTLTGLMYELPPILRKLRAQHPGIDLLVSLLPTRESVEGIMNNTLDLALVTLPVKRAPLRVTPLRPEMLVAIFPAATNGVPDVITPAYVAMQHLVLEQPRGAVYALVMQWLAGEMPLPRDPMCIGTVEAAKKAVASALGMSIVPDVAVAESSPDIVVRPLNPPLPCTLALIEHRNKSNEPALEIVRKALLELRAGGDAATVAGNGELPRALLGEPGRLPRARTAGARARRPVGVTPRKMGKPVK